MKYSYHVFIQRDNLHIRTSGIERMICLHIYVICNTKSDSIARIKSLKYNNFLKTYHIWITILHTFFLTFTSIYITYLYIYTCDLLNNSLKFPTKHRIKEFLYRTLDLKDSEETNKYEFLLLLIQNCIQNLLSYYTKSLSPFTQVFTLLRIETNTNPGILQKENFTRVDPPRIREN